MTQASKVPARLSLAKLPLLGLLKKKPEQAPRQLSSTDRLTITKPQAALAFGAKDADYDKADPGAGARGPVRQLQHDLATLGYFKSRHGGTGGYFEATRAAVMRYQADHGLPSTGRLDAATAAALKIDLARAVEGKPPIRTTPHPTPVPSKDEAPADPNPAVGPQRGVGLKKDGLTIPNSGQGKATTFWNGNYKYKGMRDRHNMLIGAWGNQNKPTDFFVALPVGSRAWHNQKILVTNPKTGQQVIALVQDKGPAGWTGAKIDLSPVTMEAIGGHHNGSLQVKFEFAAADAPVGPVR